MGDSVEMCSQQQQQRPLRVGIFHPDLGIGGAERLVVDAGLALKQHGCDVTFYTSHHDRSHCFPETADGTIPVVVAGDWLPRHILGRLNVFFAVLRSMWLMLYAFFFTCLLRLSSTNSPCKQTNKTSKQIGTSWMWRSSTN